MKKALILAAGLLQFAPGRALADGLTLGERVIVDDRSSGFTAIVKKLDFFGGVLATREPVPVPMVLHEEQVFRMEGCGQSLCVGDWVRYPGGLESGRVNGVRASDGMISTDDAGSTHAGFRFSRESEVTKVDRCIGNVCLDETGYVRGSVINPAFGDEDAQPVVISGLSPEKGTALVRRTYYRCSTPACGDENKGVVEQPAEVPLANLAVAKGCGAIYCVGDQVLDYQVDTVRAIASDGSIVLSYDDHVDIIEEWTTVYYFKNEQDVGSAYRHPRS